MGQRKQIFILNFNFFLQFFFAGFVRKLMNSSEYSKALLAVLSGSQVIKVFHIFPYFNFFRHFQLSKKYFVISHVTLRFINIKVLLSSRFVPCIIWIRGNFFVFNLSSLKRSIIVIGGISLDSTNKNFDIRGLGLYGIESLPQTLIFKPCI